MAEAQLTPHMEQYLEIIGHLEDEKEVVRVRDIASEMGVTMPSVTAALKTLSDQHLVTHGRYEHVRLTKAGRAAARQVQRRHDVLFEFLTDVLRVPASKAGRDACEMEHFVSSTTLERLIEFVEFVKACPQGGQYCLKGFDHYLIHGERPRSCSETSCPIGEYENRSEGEDGLL